MSNLFKSKKTETSKTEIDPQVYNRILENLQFAEQVAAIPYEPYRGLMVAPFTRDYMAGEEMTRRIAQEGGFVPEIEQAARAAQQALGYQPERISAERIGASLARGPERVSAGQVGTKFSAKNIGASLAGGPERVRAGRVAAPAAAQQISAGQVGTRFAPERIQAERIGASLAGGPRMVSAGQVGTTFAPERIGAGRVGTTFAARDVSAPGAAPMAQAASFLGRDVGGDLSAYMNPYQQGVVDVGLSDIDRAQEQARMQRAQRATSARAFGGSRAAIEEGIAAGEAARERNRFVAEQRAQGFREAAALREADVGRQQQVALANQAAAQEVMRLAQAGQISNQERDMRLGQMGLTAETTNVQAGLEAARANQAAQQEAQRLALAGQTTNVQAQLEAERANQAAVQEYMRAGLTAEQANQQAQMDAAARNQQAQQEAQRLGLTAETTNVQAALEAARANQQAQAERERLAAQTGQFNVQSGLEAARANQQAVQQYMQMGLSAEQANQQAQLDAQRLGSQAQQFNVQSQLEASRANQAATQEYMRMGLSAEEANQRAMMEAAQRNQAAGLEGAQFRLGAGRQLADFGQMALQNRYGAGAAMMGIGSAQQNLYQQFLNAQREEDLRRQQFPLQQLAIRQGAVSASPYNVSQTGTVTSRPSYWQMAGQVAGTVAGFSDETMKKNISKVKNPLDKVNRLKGIEFEWEDEYKGDVEENGQKPNGKSISVSAQDVEDEMPEATMRAGNGKMMVDFPQLVGLLTEAVKELDAKVEGKKRKGSK